MKPARFVVLLLGLGASAVLAAPGGNDEAKPWTYGYGGTNIIPEQEPNDVCPGQTMACGDVIAPASYYVNTDDDWYQFYVEEAGTLLTIGTSSYNGSNVDTFLLLYDSCTGGLIAYDDDSGPGLFSLIRDFSAPHAGWYYAMTRTYGYYYTGDYQLSVTCTPPQPPPPGACCFSDGTCLMLAPDSCWQSGGIPGGLGTTCDPNCCLQDGLVARWPLDEGSGNVIHNSASGCDDYPGTVLGASWEPGVMGAALTFDGVDDRVEFPGPVVGTAPYSVCTWVKTASLGEANYILDNGGCHGSKYGFCLIQEYAGGSNEWFFAGKSSSGLAGFAHSPVITPGEWTFLCGTWDGSAGEGSVRLYVNGQLTASGTPEQSTEGSECDLRFGTVCYYQEYLFHGSLDDVRIYNRVLGEEEIAALAAEPSSGVHEPTVVSSDYRLDSGQPNPFCTATRVCYELPGASPVQLAVLDVAGRLVRTLVNETRPIGRHTAVWDGRDADGTCLTGGIYFCVLTVGPHRLQTRVVLLR